MEELIKIREVAQKYDISARTLRYYEDMGLLASTRTEDYAYRLYDSDALRRLEQILILRKLNISIRDIQRVFASDHADVVLEVLGQKVHDIDHVVALLHELRAIVLDFIQQINDADFGRDADIRLLYEKASELKAQLTHVDYSGNPSQAGRVREIAQQLRQRPDVRVLQLPACTMAFSGYAEGSDPFAEGGVLSRFDQWFSEADKRRTDKFFARDFMSFDAEHQCLVWWYALENPDMDTGGFAKLAFEGGLYAVAVSRDEDDADGERVHAGIKEWVEDSGYFTLDERPGHATMFHVITSPVANKAMGYNQLEIYVPIRIK